MELLTYHLAPPRHVLPQDRDRVHSALQRSVTLSAPLQAYSLACRDLGSNVSQVLVSGMVGTTQGTRTG